MPTGIDLLWSLGLVSEVAPMANGD
eukprot:COSAG02_NODE_51428_length_314_cov_0.725581_1_plen_24_part_10